MNIEQKAQQQIDNQCTVTQFKDAWTAIPAHAYFISSTLQVTIQHTIS